MTTTTTTTTHVSIIVYRGDPVDFPQYRHTSLFIRAAADAPTGTRVHIVGPIGEFVFDIDRDYDTSNSTERSRTAKIVEVGRIEIARGGSATEFIEGFRSVPIDNADREFNCQTWVERALTRLKGERILTSAAYGAALDGMIDAIAEAEDEEE